MARKINCPDTNINSYMSNVVLLFIHKCVDFREEGKQEYIPAGNIAEINFLCIKLK